MVEARATIRRPFGLSLDAEFPEAFPKQVANAFSAHQIIQKKVHKPPGWISDPFVVLALLLASHSQARVLLASCTRSLQVPSANHKRMCSLWLKTDGIIPTVPRCGFSRGKGDVGRNILSIDLVLVYRLTLLH